MLAVLIKAARAFLKFFATNPAVTVFSGRTRKKSIKKSALTEIPPEEE
jgi:hypothetical protein